MECLSSQLLAGDVKLAYLYRGISPSHQQFSTAEISGILGSVNVAEIQEREWQPH